MSEKPSISKADLENARQFIEKTFGSNYSNNAKIVLKTATFCVQAAHDGYEKGKLEHKTADSYFERIKQKAKMGERERCAKIAEESCKAENHQWQPEKCSCPKKVAAAIRKEDS